MYRQAQAQAWLALTKDIPTNGQTLQISHGGTLEICAIACLPKAGHTLWRTFFDYCEGIPLHVEWDPVVDS